MSVTLLLGQCRVAWRRFSRFRQSVSQELGEASCVLGQVVVQCRRLENER